MHRHLSLLCVLAFAGCSHPSKHITSTTTQPANVVVSSCTIPPSPVWSPVNTAPDCPEAYVLCLDPANGRVLERNLQAQRRWIENVKLRCSDNAPDAGVQSPSTASVLGSASATVTNAEGVMPSAVDVLDGGAE